MAEAQPELPDGYLGQQPAFAELGLQVLSHPNAEFELSQDNEVEIKFKTSKPIKATTNLIQVRTEKEFPEYVFTQTHRDAVSFVIGFPEHGYYKFQVFALAADDATKSLPNVFNYVIYVKRALKPVYTFPKQYAPWRNGCYLYSPLVLNNTSRLHTVNFKVMVPNAKQVAVVAAGEWFHLTSTNDNIWEGTASLDKHRNKGVKVTLNACFGEDESKFATLLEYNV